MITLILTSETINYQKLLTYLENHKQKAIDEMDDRDIKDISYRLDVETIVQRVMFYNNTYHEYEYEYFQFTAERGGITIPHSIDELVREQILDMGPYMYMLYDDEYDGDETNVKLLGFATILEVATAMTASVGNILATTPNKSIDVVIYTEIDYSWHDYYDDDYYDDDYYGDDYYDDDYYSDDDPYYD